MGESNGGRYAVLAAATDPRISGLVAVSTSGFDRYGSTVAGDAAVFIESIDPDRLVSRISPRPLWVFHAPEDTFIPIAEGIRLYENAGEPREFVNFSGTHGINEHVDEWVVSTFGRK
jgi:predicted peptidase